MARRLRLLQYAPVFLGLAALLGCYGEPPPTPALPANCAWEAVVHTDHEDFGTREHVEMFVKRGDSWRLELWRSNEAEGAVVAVFHDGEMISSDERGLRFEESSPLKAVGAIYEMVEQGQYRGTRSIRGDPCYFYRFKDDEIGGVMEAHIGTRSLTPRHVEIDDEVSLTMIFDYYDLDVPEDADLFSSDAMTPLFEPRDDLAADPEQRR